MRNPQRSFAQKLGWTTAKLNELIKGKRGVTAGSTLDLSAALKTSAEIWLNLQMYFDSTAQKIVVKELSDYFVPEIILRPLV